MSTPRTLFITLISEHTPLVPVIFELILLLPVSHCEFRVLLQLTLPDLY